MGDDRPARYTEGDLIVYRASGLGGCARMLTACAFPDAYPPSPWPDWFQVVLDEGSAYESLIRRRWDESTGLPTVDDQMQVELEVGEVGGKLVVVRGHIDGRCEGVAPEWTGREFKKFRESGWQTFLRKGVEIHPNYPWQVAAMMHATGWDWQFVGGRLDKDGELTEVVGMDITNPPIPFKAIRDKLMGIEKGILDGFDPKEVECRVQFPCPQYKIHDPEDEAYEIPVGGGADGKAGERAREAITRLAEVQAYGRALEANLKEWKEIGAKVSQDLRDALEELGDDAVAAKVLLIEGHRVTRVRKTISEHVRRASTQDYFSAKQAEEG